jgi:O-antigen ligase
MILSGFQYAKKHSPETYCCFGLSALILICVFSPVLSGADFIFQNQTKLLLVVTALALAGCITILIKSVATSNVPIAFSPLDWLLSAYLGYLLLQLIFYQVDTKYILTILCLASCYFLFRQIPVCRFKGLLYLLPVFAVIRIIYGYSRLSEPWQGLSDITGGFYNTGIFGGFVAMGFVAASGLIFFQKPHKYYIGKILLGIILIPLTIQLIYSQSRASWLAAIAGTVIFSLPVFKKPAKFKAVVLVAVLLIIGILFSSKLYHFKKDSADGRLLIWTVSWNLFKEKPLTGFGPDGFRKNYMLRQGDYLKNHPDSPWTMLAGDTSSPFNELLKTGIEQGAIGLLFMFGIIFAVCLSPAGVPLWQAVLAVNFTFSCFSYPFSFLQFQVLTIYCLAAVARTEQPVALSVPDLIRKRWALAALALCCILLLPLYNYARVTQRWNRAMRTLPRNRDHALEEFRLLYPSLKRNSLFLNIYGGNLQLAGRYAEAVRPLEEALQQHASYHTLLLLGESYGKTKEYEKAEKTYEKASQLFPSAFMPHYSLAKLFWEQHDYRRARLKARETMNKPVKIDRPEIDWMKEEMQEILNPDSTMNAIIIE